MSFRFAHISDLHLPPLPQVSIGQILNKRLLGYLSWHRKRKHRHRAEVLSALQQQLSHQKPDHICISGDITNIGLAQEFIMAARWLRDLAPENQISFVPGNHDTYVADSVGLMQEFLQPWLPEYFPSMTRRGDVIFIGISTAVATAPFLATGRIDAKQYQGLEQALKDGEKQGLFRVVMLHHPPIPRQLNRRKSLDNVDKLYQLIKNSGAELVLHGHGHHPVRETIDTDYLSIPVFGAGSASIKNQNLKNSGHYYLFDLNENEIQVYDYHYCSQQDRFIETDRVVLPRNH